MSALSLISRVSVLAVMLTLLPVLPGQAAGSAPAPTIEAAPPTDLPGPPRPGLGESKTNLPGVDTSKPTGTVPPPAARDVTDVHRGRGGLVDPTVGDVTSMRTATSRTFPGERNGEMRTDVSPMPIHWKDATGAWRAIDNRVVPDIAMPGGFRNAANSTVVQFGPSLATPVRVTSAAGTVSIKLANARGAAKAAGSRLTYSEAMPGVDVDYVVDSAQVKETLTLESPAAPSLFSYQVQSPGLKATATRAGAVTLRDAKDGTVVFTMAAPVVWDAATGPTGADSRAVSLSLADGGTELTLRVDGAWLNDPSRVWPVTIDPNIAPFASTTCTLQDGATTAWTSYCNWNTVDLGWDGSRAARAVAKFDVAAIPPVADVTYSRLGMYLAGTSTANSTPVGMYGLKHAFDNTASWVYSDSSGYAWHGGDNDRDTAATYTTTVAASAGWKYWAATRLVQDWVDGTRTNHGIMLREPTENVTQRLQFWSGTSATPSGLAPVLSVSWTMRTGSRSYYTTLDEKLSDRSVIRVNPATGDASVRFTDLAVDNYGPDFVLERVQSSLTSGGLGGHWQSEFTDTYLEILNNDDALLWGPDNYVAPFTRTTPTGAFVSSSGDNTTLVRRADNTYAVTVNATDDKYTFGTSGGVPLTKEDRNGNKLNFEYAPGTICITKVTDNRGRTFTFTRDTTVASPAKKYLSVKDDATGRTVTYTYTNGLISSVTDANGKVTTYGYNTRGDVTEIIDPENHITRLAYNSTTNRVTSVTRVTNNSTGAGNTTSYAYTYDAGKASGSTVVTNPLGNIATYTFDTKSRVTQVKDHYNRTRSQSYSPNSAVATSTDAFGKITTNEFDSNNNLTSTRVPTKASVSAVYPTTGLKYLPSSRTDSRGNQTTFGYDTVGNVVTSTSGGLITRNLYQGATDPATGLIVRCRRNSDGSIGDAKPGTLCSTRDGAWSSAAPNAHRVSYLYDDKNQLVVQNNADGGAIGDFWFTYDAASRRASVTDGKGQQTTYAYDAIDRLTSITYQGGSKTEYTYDGAGNRLTAVEKNSSGTVTRTTTFAYDSLNRLTSQVSPEGNVFFTYDAANNMTSYTDPAGTVSYSYDAVNNLVKLQEPGGNCSPYYWYGSLPTSTSKCTVFGYNDNNQRTMIYYPGGNKQETAYGDAGEFWWRTATTAGGTAVVGYDVGYDHAGLAADPANPSKNTMVISRRVDATDEKLWYGYTYDSLGRLTYETADHYNNPNASGFALARRYCYDNAGNRTGYKEGFSTDCSSPSASYSYNGANELTSTSPGGSFTYDANGSETAAPTHAGLAARATTYNTRDQAATFSVSGGTAQAQGYEGESQALRVTSAGNTFTNTPFGINRATGNLNLNTTRDPSGALIGLRVGSGSTSTNYYYFKDHQDSVLGVVSSGGVVANRYRYAAYGVTTFASETVRNPFRYISGYLDKGSGTTETGLYKLGLRYYDPSLGRFTQPDPTGQDFGYLYSADDPLNRSDPTGADWGFTITSRDFAAIAVAGGTAAAIAAVLDVSKVVAIAIAAVTAAAGLLAAYGCNLSVNVNEGTLDILSNGLLDVDLYGCSRWD